jgi:glycosyltransferase involved in cell wall biosynthesis
VTGGTGALRILFLTQTYPRHAHDSAGPFIRDLARGLVRGGDSVRILAPHARGLASAWQEEGVEVRTFRYAPERFELLGYGRSLQADERMAGAAAAVALLYLLGARRALRGALADGGWDVVQAHWVVPNLLAAAFCGGRLPLLVGLHGSDVFMAEKGAVRPFVRRALRRVEGLTSCSPELAARVQRIGFPAERSHVIPYGVDSALFSPDAARRGVWRERLGISPDAPMLLGVGRMATKKGFHLLLEALPALFAAVPEAHLVLAGGGDRLEEFRRAAAAFAGRVHFPGAVLHDTLPDLYRAADLFVLPAVHDAKGNVDGLPNVILEAMASGLPVVGSRVSGLPTAIAEGVNGWLAEEGSAADLTRILREALADRSRRERFGAAGRERARREFSWDSVAARYRAAYVAAVERFPMAG